MATLTLIITSPISERLPGLCRGALKLLTSFPDRILNVLSTLSVFKPSDCCELWKSSWPPACYSTFCAKLCQWLIEVSGHPCTVGSWVSLFDLHLGKLRSSFWVTQQTLQCWCLFLMAGTNSFPLRVRITSSAFHGGLAASGETGLIPTRCVTPGRLQSWGEEECLWVQVLSQCVHLQWARPHCSCQATRETLCKSLWQRTFGSWWKETFSSFLDVVKWKSCISTLCLCFSAQQV